MAPIVAARKNRTMFTLDDLSPAALETLAELIEERLENPEAGFAPATWHQSQARSSAARELNQALDDRALACWVTGQNHAGSEAPTLH
jgi:hypothetical protein